MLKGESIICFANDWDGDPLSKKHVMLRLAKHNRILWVNSIGNRNPTVSGRDLKRIIKKLYEFSTGLRRVHENIWVFTPILVPFHNLQIARSFNERFLAASIKFACWRLGFKNPITWTFVPSSADVVGDLGEKLVLYHCVDEYSQFADASREAIEQIETKLLNKSDLVIASAAKLYESKQKINENTHLVLHGVDFEHFAQSCRDTLEVPEDILRLPHPIIGFHGLIANWVDIDLIEKIATTHPDWSIVLLGKIHSDGVRPFNKKLKNIHYLGRKDYSELPGYCKAFDVAMVPFVVNELTVNANPLKMREYLASGLPVVSTDIPEAHRFGSLVSVGRDHDHFIKQIETILENGTPGPNIIRSLQMRGESWDARVDQMCNLVETRLGVKTKTDVVQKHAA
jgi:glycosyltransferase involved in cell wall biosynthesis